MTGYTVHTGTTIKFSESWDRIFQKGAATPARPKKAPKKKPASGTARKKAGSKRTVKKKR